MALQVDHPVAEFHGYANRERPTGFFTLGSVPHVISRGAAVRRSRTRRQRATFSQRSSGHFFTNTRVRSAM